MQDINRFIKNNFNLYHIIGMSLGVAFGLVYWYKTGQYSHNILKSSAILMSLWGILVGYILMDLVFNSRKSKKNEDDEN